MYHSPDSSGYGINEFSEIFQILGDFSQGFENLIPELVFILRKMVPKNVVSLLF